MSTVPLKITCGDDLRRVALPAGLSFTQLSAALSEMFNLESLSHTFAVKYTDDEGDLVTVTDDAELGVMFADYHAAAGQLPLRLEIFRCQKTPNGKGFPRPRGLHQEVAPEPPAQIEAPAEPDTEPDAAAEGHTSINDLAHQLAAGHPTMKFGPHGHGRHGGRFHHGHGRQGWQGFQGHGGCGRGWGRGGGRGGGGGHGGRGQCGGGGCKSRFVTDVTLADGTVVEPSTPVTKIWKMSNQGSMAWPEGTTLLHVAGDALLAEPTAPIQVAPCDPGAEVEIAADLVAPTAPGRYISYFRLQGPRGHRFGQRIWVMLLVSADGSGDDLSADDLAEQGTRHPGGGGGGGHGGRHHNGMSKDERRAHRIENLRAKSHEFAAKAAEVKSQIAHPGATSAGAGHRHERHQHKAMQKVARLEAKSAMFKQKLAVLQLGVETAAMLSPAQQQLLTEKQEQGALTHDQIEAVCTAITAGEHLGIVCDVSGQTPILGTRFTKPAPGSSGGESYDICEAVYAELEHEEQETFEAIPCPEIEIVIRTVLAQQPPTSAGEEDEKPAADGQEQDQGESPLVSAPPRAILAAVGSLSASAIASAAALASTGEEEAVPPSPTSDDGGFEIVSSADRDWRETISTVAAAVVDAPDAAEGGLEAALGQLQAMGFNTDDNPRVMEALRASAGDVQGALEALLAQQSA